MPQLAFTRTRRDAPSATEKIIDAATTTRRGKRKQCHRDERSASDAAMQQCGDAAIRAMQRRERCSAALIH
jgi:hypothetical protein